MIKVKIELPKKIDIDDVEIAVKIKRYNLNGFHTHCEKDSYDDNKITHVTFGMNGMFIGMLPKAWFVRQSG